MCEMCRNLSNERIARFGSWFVTVTVSDYDGKLPRRTGKLYQNAVNGYFDVIVKGEEQGILHVEAADIARLDWERGIVWLCERHQARFEAIAPETPDVESYVLTVFEETSPGCHSMSQKFTCATLALAQAYFAEHQKEIGDKKYHLVHQIGGEFHRYVINTLREEVR